MRVQLPYNWNTSTSDERIAFPAALLSSKFELSIFLLIQVLKFQLPVHNKQIIINIINFRLSFQTIAIMPTKEAITTDKAPPPMPFFSQAIKCQGIVYCSGSIGMDPKTMKLVEGSVADRAVRFMIFSVGNGC
jgi:hypothetical protein